MTIPNKAKHITDRDELKSNFEKLGTRIVILKRQRGEIETQKNTDINLDNAIDVLNQLENNVQAFNKERQAAQTAIDKNNEALQRLRDSIKSEITQAEAIKAAADAAAAETAAEAAALQKANDSLQAYIASLQTQLQGINDNRIDDIVGQIQTSATTINQYGAQLDDSVSSAGDAISQATREAIAAFKNDTGKEVTTKTREFNALNGEFDLAKKTIVDGLNAKIQALQDIAGGAKVTAEAINAALDTDKTNPGYDKNLDEIKGRATALAAEFGEKANEFETRKAEIEGKIEEDKKLAEIRKEIEGLEDRNEDNIKYTESTVVKNVNKVIDETNSPIQAVITTTLKKATASREETGINAFLITVKRNIGKFYEKINTVRAKLTQIQNENERVKIQSRLDALNTAKAEYDRLSEAQNARAAALTAENAAVRSRSPSPETAQLMPQPPSSARPVVRSRPLQGTILQPADAEDSSVPEPKRTPGRRYSIFIPTPVQKKTSTSRTEAAAANNPENTEDAIDPNVLEIFVYEDENKKKSVGASTGAKEGGGIIQRGGEPPKVAKIIKVKQITPEIQNLFLSFKTPSEILTHEFLEKIQENKESTEVVDTPKDIDAEMAEMAKQKDEIIQNDDTTDFLSKLGQKAAHQTTIEKLMIFLNNSKNEKNKPIRTTQNTKTYQDMYVRLWQFMEYTSGSIAILRSVFANKDTKMTATLLAANQSGISQRRNDLTWSAPQMNILFNTLFMEFSKCYNKDGNDDGTYSKFLEEQVSGKGAQKYRFMLNWIILIAFHWYYIQKEKSQQDGLIDCGEFIEHLYHTFIGWMEKMDSQSLKNVFTGGKTYEQHVDEYIVSDFKTDGSLKSLISGIRKYLCRYTKKGTRENTNPKQQSDDKSKSSSQPQSVKRPSSATRLKESEVLKNVSEVAQGVGNDARATTTSPSPRKVWMNNPVGVRIGPRIGPKTPSTPPSQASPPSVPRPQSHQSLRVFRHVSPKSEHPVPPLKLESIPQEPQETQSARTSEELLSDLQRQLPQSARIPPRPGNIKSLRPGNVNIHNPFGRKSQSGSFLPGDNVDSQPVGYPDSEGTGDLSFLDQQQGPSQYEVLINPKPQPPQVSNKNNGTFRSRIAGHKRTRKHRRPAPASTPAPATRRHRVHSSSSQKHTRRRRPQRREH